MFKTIITTVLLTIAAVSAQAGGTKGLCYGYDEVEFKNYIINFDITNKEQSSGFSMDTDYSFEGYVEETKTYDASYVKNLFSITFTDGTEIVLKANTASKKDADGWRNYEAFLKPATFGGAYNISCNVQF